MSEIVITTLEACTLPDKFNELSAIFFESSARKTFASQEERDQFFMKYLGCYLKAAPELTLVAWDEKILGYITGLSQSSDEKLLQLQPHMKIFEEYFFRYPAHLHINMHHEARGLGLGSKLLIDFENKLKQKNVTGVHLITSPSSRNREFYRKNGYNFEAERSFNGSELLMIGKSL